MSNQIMKHYTMPENLKTEQNLNSTKFETTLEMAFEEMTESFAKKQDDAIINYLYNKYKDTNVSSVYVLSRPDFEKFLLEMLPKWIKK